MQPIATYGYNAAGDLTQKAGPGSAESFGYDILGRMTAYTAADGLTRTMKYDAEGKRVRQIDPDGASREFLYNGEDILYTRWQSEEWSYIVDHFLHGTGIDEPLSSWKVFQASPKGVISIRELYLHSDALGSIRQMYYPQYDHLTELDYDAWGQLAYNPDDMDTSWAYGYTGREFFGDSYYFYRARYYEPAVGRFTQRDPTAFSPDINYYIYVNDNPIMLVDPKGLQSCFKMGFSWASSWQIVGQASIFQYGLNLFNVQDQMTQAGAAGGGPAGIPGLHIITCFWEWYERILQKQQRLIHTYSLRICPCPPPVKTFMDKDITTDERTKEDILRRTRGMASPLLPVFVGIYPREYCFQFLKPPGF